MSEMAEFAANFINEGLAGMRIQGFGPGNPPPPLVDPEDLEVIGPPSPLAAIAPKPVTGATLVVSPDVSTTQTIAVQAVTNPAAPPTLFVLDKSAIYRGQETELSEREQQAIAQIVLKAVVKRAKEQYQAVVSQITKRAYRRKNAEAQGGSGSGVRGSRRGRKSGDGQRKGPGGSGGVPSREGNQQDPQAVGEAGAPA